MTASNMVEMPRDLVARLVAALETPLDLDEQDVTELIQDTQAYFPDGIQPQMKAVVVTLLAGDDGDVRAIQNDVGETLAQHWPMFAWDIRDATEAEIDWFRRVYHDG